MPVSVKFSGDTGDFVKAVSDLHDHMQDRMGDLAGSVDDLKSHIDGFGAGLKDVAVKAGVDVGKIGEAFKAVGEHSDKAASAGLSGWLKLFGVGGVIAGAAGTIYAAYKALHQMNEGFIEMKRNAEEAGMSLQAFQEFQIALGKTVSADKVNASLQEAAKKLNELSYDAGSLGKFLDANNIKWKDATGNIIDIDHYLLAAADILQRAKNWPEAFKAGEMLGLSKEVTRELQKGPVVLEQMTQAARNSGKVISEQLIDKSIEFEKKWNETVKRWADRLKQAIIDVTPFIEKLGSALAAASERALAGTRRLAGQPAGLDDAERIARAADAVKTTSEMPLWPGLADAAAKFDRIDKDVNDTVAAANKPTRLLTGAGIEFPDDNKDKGAVAAAMRQIEGEIQVLHQGFEQKRIIFDAEAKMYDLMENKKFALLEAAAQKEYEAELALLQKEAALGDLSVQQKARVMEKIVALKAKHETEMVRLDTQSILAQQAMWEKYTSAVTSAFNSQLRGLLAGTTSWSTAFKNILADLLIKFIEMVENMVAKWITAELAKTTATTTGAAARASAETAGAGVGLLAQIGNSISVIMADAAKTFAGVFAFLSPEMGPAAAGPAAESSAAVAAAAGAVPALAAGTDMILKPGLAFLHTGESVVPAAQTSGPWTGAGGGSGGPPVTLNVALQAIDTQTGYAFLQQHMPMLARQVALYMSRNPGARPSFA